MQKPYIPENELERLDALKSYSILDTMEEDDYDFLTSLASQICNTKISLVSFVDEKRQWFKSHTGLDARETPRDISFCAHAINNPNEIFEIEDSRLDERFQDNPLVTGAPDVIFYAGMPMVDSQGMPLGSFCVIDDKPKKLNEEQKKALKTLSHQVVKLLELRRKNKENDKLIKELELNNKALSQFASTAAHDLKSPLNSIIPVVDTLKAFYSDVIDEDGVKLLNIINSGANQLNNLIDGILEYSQNIHNISKTKETFYLNDILSNIISVFKEKVEIKLSIDSKFEIFSNKVALEQIFLNLISNGIKYNDKENPIIKISVFKDNSYVKINIEDNGMGIPKDEIDQVFDIFQTTSNSTQNGSKSTGIGLATVYSLIHSLDGKINISSEVGVGTKFEITI